MRRCLTLLLLLFAVNAWATCNLTLRNSVQSCYVGIRLYEVLVPSIYKSNGPMIIAYHGKGDTAANFSSTSGLIATAKKYGYVIVFPQGEVSDDGTRTWNGYWNPFFIKTPPPDDVTFTASIIAALESGLAVNPKQIFLTGFSNGGWIEHRVAIELGTEIAAISTMGSGPWIEPAGQHDTMPSALTPVSVLILFDDSGVANGGSLYCGGLYSADNTTRAGADDSFNFWMGADKATPNTSTQLCTGEGGQPTSLNMKSATGGLSNTEVQFYRLIGGIHKWYAAAALNIAPGNKTNPYNPNFSSTTGTTTVDIVSKFLLAHPKP